MPDEPRTETLAEEPRDRPLAPGDLLTPKYEIVRTIGSGGMGVVYEAKNLQTHARVAIKMLRRRALGVDGAVARFAREARATGLLRSPHVARVLDADTTADHVPFLVMEYYEGGDLHSELHQHGALSVAETCGHLLQTCAGLAEAHAAGIIHRDLKPSNLFLSREGAERRLRILDFGVSKHLASNDDLTESAASIGTPNYMAPEQVRNAKAVDHRADIWALGVILYRCLTGRAPFHGTTTSVAISIVSDTPDAPRTLVPTLPIALENVVLRALEKDPAQRFASVAELARALAPFADRAVARAALAEIALYEGAEKPPPAVAVADTAETSVPVTGERLPTRSRAAAIALVVLVVGGVALIATRKPAEPAVAPAPTSSPAPVVPPVVVPEVSIATPASAVPSASASASVSKKPGKAIKKKPRVEDPDLLP